MDVMVMDVDVVDVVIEMCRHVCPTPLQILPHNTWGGNIAVAATGDAMVRRWLPCEHERGLVATHQLEVGWCGRGGLQGCGNTQGAPQGDAYTVACCHPKAIGCQCLLREGGLDGDLR